MIQLLRSLAFIAVMYVTMLIFAIAYAPWAILNANGAFAACISYSKWVRWLASWMVGLKSEIRGTIPEGEVLIASKHQSFFDIIMIVSVVKRPRFIMKASLRFAPLLGWYSSRMRCIRVDRGKRAKAVVQMVEGVNRVADDPGQLIIYPQGTRVAPGADKPYKIGTAILYSKTGQSCVPAATNVGVFWPRHGLLRKPGLAVVEFLDPIEPGLETGAFMAKLEETVETASDALMAEAGFKKDA